jgi:hypothetical protein
MVSKLVNCVCLFRFGLEIAGNGLRAEAVPDKDRDKPKHLFADLR